MSETEINIAIAEACGYVPHENNAKYDLPLGMSVWIKPDGGLTEFSGMPDYCNDLNAMAAAIATLTDSEEIEFDANLEIVMQRDEGNGWFAWQPKACQLAEAFLKTKEIEE